ncbi:helix-turn-helix domain-containing protein [Streptomyces sp. NBC_00341]|uniref:helix-turn-helix transcriptional regulator n=1 Tax=Streptomyces sp. NBC_00341 TaxID=2975717 RepID=UPI003089035B|nr:helix-turn-helix domain-containing protein [Streptomyces sp. NBC_00341]
MSTRPVLTQREAATACGVSRTTIRRRRGDGDLPGAVQDPKRGWMVPVEDLLAAGFRLDAPAGPDASPSPPGDGEHQDVTELEHAHALALAEERHGRELAEAQVEHLRAQLATQAEHIGDLRQALAALMPAPERKVVGCWCSSTW